MLFERIRRTQKPVFIILAIFFALGFVLFGIGTGTNAPSLADLINDNSGSSQSIDDLEKRVAENPRDAGALERLASQQVAEGKQDDAILTLQRYVVLRPQDDLQLSQLATLLETKANRIATRAQVYQAAAGQAQSASTASAVTGLKLGTGVQSPIVEAAAAPYQQRATELQTQAQTTFSQATQIWQQLVELDPQNAGYQFSLAQNALNAQDYQTALTALEEYLKLEPDAPNEQDIRGVIRQLRPLVEATQGASSGGGAGQ